ncbi:MAG: valine--tRNA ligase [Chthoniobacterales bacterium]
MAELSKAYEPQAVEAKWYARWLADGCFTADPASPKPAYAIVIPPPNVTGVLTLGHVLNNTIQDILARRARMLGKEVLWLPGVDHAGIATQTVVERKIRKEEGKTRRDLGREEFLRRVWEWKEKHGGIIIEQLKRLGCSCDWSRGRFTMDPEYSGAVQRTFVDLYRKGLIYRGRRMVNWDPVALTALSDEEVIPTPQKSALYYVRYELVDEPGSYLEVATTRPETIMADVALAVHPEDARYHSSLGKKVWRPLDRAPLPVISDAGIDPEFGTGILKVTPAHDKLDFEIGQRHGLPVIDVLHPNGRINCAGVPELDGLDRFAARKKAAELLAERGLLAKEQPHESTVGFSERAGVPIEPRLSEQWFLKYPKVEEARAAVGPDEKIRFRPERWETVYQHWLENIQDWCISRQLWWGHRIPVWYRVAEASSLQPDESRKLAPGRGRPTGGREARATLGLPDRGNIHVDLDPPADPENWTQDPDVLDTWFSSWLWPFETMDMETRKKFYPTNDLVTAPDIIFFWVARMIMAGLEFTGEVPFHDVFFTGLIRDAQGRKMSKSLGNSPDPLDLIGKYGADGLRFGLMRIAPSGQDIRFDEKQIEEGRNFANKVWNAARFRQMQGGEREGEIDPRRLTSDDKWILLRLDIAIRAVTEALQDYHFNEAAQALYRFFWSEFCDWYLEASKAVLGIADATPRARKTNTLAVIDFVLGHALRLFHPFMPFITEELWHGLGFNCDLPKAQGGQTIQFAHWPQPLDDDFKKHYGLTPNDEQFANAKYETVTAGRRLRRDFHIASNKKVAFVLVPSKDLPDEEAAVLQILLNAERLDLPRKYEATKGTPTALTPLGELYLPLEGLLDVAAERQRLGKEIAKVEAELVTVRKKLANQNFVTNAPGEVVAEHRQREKDFAERLAQLERMRDSLG